ncbi:MAG: chemotaxis protein CheA [Bacteroidetes bacterium]|nr:chemotaxis protein CheA [Bacteroidota bacterium]
MEDFRKLFFDEAQDLLSKLEESLLLLEDDFEKKDLINEVFRIMHSLKGSGAMFGFSNLSKFTHNLETLYDEIRSDTITLNSEIITFTMQCGDHISKLLENDDDDELLKVTDDLKTYIDNLLKKTDTTSHQLVEDKSKHSEITTKSGNKVLYIKFEPNEDIFNDGTNPLYLVDELIDFGETIVKLNYNNLPDFYDINPEKCYLSWTILLSTNKDKRDISDVFIFVEDESNIVIEVLSDKDLFSLKNSVSILKHELFNNHTNFINLKTAAITLEEQLSETDIIIPIDQKSEIKEENKTTVESNKKEITKPVNQAVTNPQPINIDTVKVSSIKLDSLINLVSELITTQARLVTIAHNNRSNELSALSEDFQHLTRQFRDIAFDMRLIPIETIVVKFKRLVRDLSKSMGKKVNLVAVGTETELDKNIISALSDPIMHIIRNAIDHGIELPETRKKNNKPETGTIYFDAKYSGTSIIIQIKDDGAGINTAKVLQKALANDLIQLGDDLTNEQIFNLLMLPGFSTSEVVTNISGRGVGMDVVRKKILDLHGEVNITSEEGVGTSVKLKLPLTLSIIDGLLVTINNESFIIPLSSVVQIYQVNEKKIRNSVNNIIDIEGVQFPFVNLPKKFDNSSAFNQVIHFITVSYHNKTVGLVVNELISEYQAVLKPIGSIQQNNELFAGATILGDGKIAFVMDTNKVIDFYSDQKNDEHE